MQPFDVVIVGGGLSGLAVLHGIQSLRHQSATAVLLEAQSKIGGRLRNDSNGSMIDMGGAWLWPDHQPHARQLLKELAIPTFPQPDDPSSTRVEGGAVRLVNRLSQDLEGDIRLSTPVVSCSLKTDEDGRSVIHVATASNEIVRAHNVVLALPPALIAKSITFDPPLGNQKDLESSKTWMAGVTKVALVYTDRFWDRSSSNMGLPGGPAFQVYDSSTRNEETKALTFFAFVSPDNRNRDDRDLASSVADQIGRVWKAWGLTEQAEKVQSFTAHHVHRWPRNPFISDDPNPSRVHPHPGPNPALSKPQWGGRLQFAGSETDLSSPGVMEGALGAAKRVVHQLKLILGAKEESTRCESR